MKLPAPLDGRVFGREPGDGGVGTAPGNPNGLDGLQAGQGITTDGVEGGK